MTRRSSLAALVAVAALAVAGCSNNDAKPSDIENAMTDAGLDEDQAACIADGIDGEYDQDTLNEIASASDPSEFPEGVEAQIDGVLDDCLGNTAGDTTDSTGDTSTTDGSGADDTTTTEG